MLAMETAELPGGGGGSGTNSGLSEFDEIWFLNGAANLGNVGGPILIKPGSKGGSTAGKRFTPRDRREQLKEDPSKTCVYCGREGEGTTLDHVIPRRDGGNREPQNREWSCPHCNSSKGAGERPVNPPPGYEGPWPPPWW